MTNTNQFDVVVIGGGPGGYIAAIRAAQLGLSSACIESRGALGGTCLNVGCIPSKALLESSEFFAKTKKHAHEFGVRIESVAADVAAMIQRKSTIVQKFTRGIEGLFKKNKVTYFKGHGSIVGPHSVVVKSKDSEAVTIDARHIIIATGSVPVELSIARFDGKVIVSSTEALEFTEPPQHLVVVGGGVIGLEMGSVWSRLGSKVTVIEASPNILNNMDSAVIKSMTKIMGQQGLTLLTGTKLKGVEVNGSQATVLADGPKGEPVSLEADKVLIAVGRRAFTEGLGLESVGIETQKNGKVMVNDMLQTKQSHIYAIGDVIDGPMLAHKAEEEGVAVAERIAGKHGHVNYEAIPSVIYTWPEVASVGLTEEQCKDRGLSIKTGQFPFAANGRAACSGTTDGFVKLIADQKTDRLLGAHIVGPTASELIAELAVAMEFSASSEDIARSVHAHPTLAEVIKEAALAVDQRSLSI